MNTLYPLKFKPIFKEKIWGGQKLGTILNKKINKKKKIGESWEISSVKGNISVVKNGFLKGNNIQELIEVYMGDLIGEKVYLKFGIEFPLLVKYIDANEFLSVQVHPDDDMAMRLHQAYGKTEMWYIIDSDTDSKIVIGFNRNVNKTELMKCIENDTLTELLHFENVEPADVFYIPAGLIHATGAGILLAEIQQTSDITYRIYDWGRMENGKRRELHYELAMEAINYSGKDIYRIDYQTIMNNSSKITECRYFTTSLININNSLIRNYENIDTFVIYLCISGSCNIIYDSGSVIMQNGETILIPATIKILKLVPLSETRILEVFIA